MLASSLLSASACEGRFSSGILPPEGVDEVGAVEVDAGSDHACVRTREGEVFCWGNNRVGQVDRDTPSDAVDNLHLAARGVDDLYLSDQTTCVHGADEWTCWGRIRSLRERAAPKSAANRVYVALTELRRLGLRALLERGEGGYRFSPSLPLEVLE